ncbi:hypothetical protein CHU98_g901, partial [Xylaria longipes]
PEPVVRVLLLAATTATTTTGSTVGTPTPVPSTIGETGGWAQQQQQHDGGFIMGGSPNRGAAAAAAAAPEANTNSNTGSWGLRPGTLNPGFSTGGGSVWELDEWAPGSAACGGQIITSDPCDDPALRWQQYTKMISPPETPPFSMSITGHTVWNEGH